MSNTTTEKVSPMAEARFDSAQANSLSIEEVLDIIQSGSYTKALTIHYKDGAGNCGRTRISAPTKNASIDEKLLFFSFDPEDPEDNSAATRVVMETVFLRDTYGKQWFLCDPLLA